MLTDAVKDLLARRNSDVAVIPGGTRMLYLARKLTDTQETLFKNYLLNPLVQPFNFNYCDVVWGDRSKTHAQIAKVAK